MRFLLSTYSTAFLSSGGGESEMVQIAETLNDGGAHADIYGLQSRPLDFYDAVMHFSVQAEGWAFFEAVNRTRTPILLWPNVWWRSTPDPKEIERIKLFIDCAHKVLFKSYAEKKNFEQHVQVPQDKSLVIPICVSQRFAATPDLELARTLCETNEYVLCLGRVEPVKNQLNLIRAIKQLGMRGVLVGGHHDADYFNRCKMEGEGFIEFLPFVKPCSHLLISLLAASHIVAEPCLDPAGRSSLEAAQVNKPLVLSADDWVDEYFGDTVYKAEPASVESIVDALRGAAADVAAGGRASLAHDRIALKHASEEAVHKFVTNIIDACDA